MRPILSILLVCTVTRSPLGAAAERPAVVFDFESGELQGWRIVEGEFYKPIVDREFYVNHPKQKYNKQGKYYLATVEHSSGRTSGKPTGVVESPVFVLTGARISLLVGGGSHDNTYVALCTDDGTEVLHARGKNTEVFQPVTWDASELVGRRVFLKAVDLHPGGWGYIALDDVQAEGRLDPQATEARIALREEQRRKQVRRDLLQSFQTQSEPLRAAIEDFAATFGDRYPRGQELLDRLDHVLSRLSRASLEEVEEIGEAFESLRREALLANPLVSGQPILFVARPQYVREHGTEATMYQTGEVNTHCFRGGGAMKLLHLPGREVETLLETPQGIIRDPEVHFDGQRVLFSMRRDIKDDYHLYEIDLTPLAIAQRTFGSRVSDIQPIYLPDDSIVFSSTRDPKYIPCQRHLMANLFRLEADGASIRQLGFNTQFEGRASLMPDGRILYTRWEYVDKHFSSAYGLWTVNPDGTNHALYYGNYAWQPGAIVDGRVIPGAGQFVAVFTSVHDLGWGAMVIADRSQGLDGTAPIRRSWPADLGGFMSQWDTEERIGNRYDSFMGVRVKYEDPYPLSEKHFLCVRQLGREKQTGIFLVDTFGNEVLLHEEAPGCFDPMPLGPRPRPPLRPSQVDTSRDEGSFYVQNVYLGDYMDHVEPGSVKYLRVVEAPAKRAWVPRGMGDWAAHGSSDSHHPVAVNWHHYNNKRVLGTVPVEADGSAYFTAPAGRFVYFQLLDERGRMIHSMRSGTMLQPGERQGCVGCHENRLESASGVRYASIALRRAPSELDGWHGAARNFSYTADVQPVLEKHCVECHDYGREAEEVNLCGDKGLIFSHSYVNLMRSSPSYYRRAEHEGAEAMPLVSTVGAGPVKILPPYSWGSHRSGLVKLLDEGHYDVKLDAESLDRIVTWIDLNAPYYPSHQSYYWQNTAGRSPLDHQQLMELGKLVRESPGGAQYGWNKVNEYLCNQLGRLMATHGPVANFTRPEHSLCLEGFRDANDPRHARALELIRQGQRNLQEHLRCDMPGFLPCEAHQEQLKRLAERRRAHSAKRQIGDRQTALDGTP